MTAEIRIQRMDREHMTRQPEGFPYALFCHPVYSGDPWVKCESRRRMGFVGDFKSGEEVLKAALEHPHAALIKDFSSSRALLVPDKQ